MVDEIGIEQKVTAEPKKALDIETRLTTLTDKLGKPETSSQVQVDVRTKLINTLGEVLNAANPRGLTPHYEAIGFGRDTRIPPLPQRMEFLFAGIGEVYAKVVENQTPGSKGGAQTSLEMAKSVPVPEQRIVSEEEEKAREATGEFVIQTLNLPEEVKSLAEKGWEVIWQALKRADPETKAQGIWANLRRIGESQSRLGVASKEEKSEIQKAIKETIDNLKTFFQPPRERRS